MGKNEIYDKNWIWRDYITEDITCFCVGEIDMYFFKETMFGVRDNRAMTAHFITVESIPTTSSPYAPTLNALTEEHIKEAIMELDTTNEQMNRVHIDDIMSLSMEMMSKELALLVDEKLLGSS